MSKHTPGPWTINRVSRATVNANGYVVASCGGHSDNSRDAVEVYEELCANARLIAAAPDLLDALISAEHALRSYQYGNTAAGLAEEIANRCRAAIAKATP